MSPHALKKHTFLSNSEDHAKQQQKVSISKRGEGFSFVQILLFITYHHSLSPLPILSPSYSRPQIPFIPLSTPPFVPPSTPPPPLRKGFDIILHLFIFGQYHNIREAGGWTVCICMQCTCVFVYMYDCNCIMHMCVCLCMIVII